MLILQYFNRGRHFSLTYYQAFMAERFRMTAGERFTMLSGIAHGTFGHPKAIRRFTYDVHETQSSVISLRLPTSVLRS